MEVGPRDVSGGKVTLARRDLPGREGKAILGQEGLAAAVRDLLDDIHESLYQRALKFQRDNTHDPKDYEEFKEVVQDGWAESWWCGDAACEAVIKEETKATTRNIPLEQSGGSGHCIHCGKVATERAIFGKAY